MKDLFTEGTYTARGTRKGATYSVEIVDANGTIVAYRWFNDATKNADKYVPAKFYDMIHTAISKTRSC